MPYLTATAFKHQGFSMAATKIRWGDTLDEDDSLPSNSIVGPDKSGVVTKTTYSRNDKGEILKTVVKTRVSRVEKKIYAVSPSHHISSMLCYHTIGLLSSAAACAQVTPVQVLHARLCRMQQQGSRGSNALGTLSASEQTTV